MNYGQKPIVLAPVFHAEIIDELINIVNMGVTTKIKLTHLVHLNDTNTSYYQTAFLPK